MIFLCVCPPPAEEGPPVGESIQQHFQGNRWIAELLKGQYQGHSSRLLLRQNLLCKKDALTPEVLFNDRAQGCSITLTVWLMRKSILPAVTLC